MDNRVYVISCHDYAEAGRKVPELLEWMGGMNHYVSPGETIILKPNLLQMASPERAVTTHPDIIASVGRLVSESGANPVIADSPGAGLANSRAVLKMLYQICHMDRAATDGSAVLNWNLSTRVVSFPEGRLIRRFELIEPAAEADGIINLCKMKTHSFMGMTGAVKNLFGVITGLTKPGYHAKLQDTGRFAGMLLDLMDLVSPRLSIMDAVIGMEGNGPHAGSPRHVGYLFAAINPLAIDVLVSECMGLPPEKNAVLSEARNRGLSPLRMEDLEIIGERPSPIPIPDFRLPDTFFTGAGFGMLPPFLAKTALSLIRNGITMRPYIHKDRCIACGQCSRACPVHVISINNGRFAQINHNACIRCYCCHEMCPENAISLKQGWLSPILGRL